LNKKTGHARPVFLLFFSAKEGEINVMIREKMLDQVKEKHPRIASYVRIF